MLYAAPSPSVPVTPIDSPAALGQAMRHARKQLGLTQPQLALAAGVEPGRIFEHVTDSLHNQALKASRKVGRTLFPSQLQDVEGDDEGVAGECADVSMVFKDFCWVAKVENLDQIEAEKNQRFTQLGDYNVLANGCIYRHKPHVKTVA